MNVFQLRDEIIQNYEAFVRSFVRIRDTRIAERVDSALKDGSLWPESLVQLNPSFEPGKTIGELVAEGLLQPVCAKIFSRKSNTSDPGTPLKLHLHQEEAIRTARDGRSYVLTTGTGSGKSLGYLIPIVDAILRRGSGKGIQAIVVYPMNALANSQEKELEKFLNYGFPDGKGPVTFRRYTGQESDETRTEIIAHPPDILLTNYVMLELLLTRPKERKLVESARRLGFLVLDELHTYRGRSGADVALLLRRTREACQSPNVQLVGTSATLATEGSWDEQRSVIASVASRLFGAEVRPQDVIGETLRRTTPEFDSGDPTQLAKLRARLVAGESANPKSFPDLLADPVAAWVETLVGLEREESSGRWQRARPQPLRGSDGLAQKLAAATGVEPEIALLSLQQSLLSGYAIQQPETGRPVFAFRLHQFIGKGETVWSSLEEESSRHLTLEPQRFAPGASGKRLLVPLAFCRDCGQEYYTVHRRQEGLGEQRFTPRSLSERSRGKEAEAGFLYLSTEEPWPIDPNDQLERLPPDWIEETPKGIRVRKDKQPQLPRPVRIGVDGIESPGEGQQVWFFTAPFRVCLRCGVSHFGRLGADFGRLSTLSSEGRSSATTVLSLSLLRQVRQQDPSLAKLLTFTDNRQDASLQAGHLNDFVQMAMLRIALHRAVKVAGPEGLRSDQVAEKVTEAMDLPFEAYASDSTVKYKARLDTQQALKDTLGYRVFRDLQRGWRITSPNLEQCGLLEIEYQSLDELCSDQEPWEKAHPALAGASPQTREKVSRTLLDLLRRDLAIKVEYLDPQRSDAFRHRSFERLRAPWAFDEEERLEQSSYAFPKPRSAGGDDRFFVYLSARGGFGQFLRRTSTFPDFNAKLAMADAEQILRDLFEALRKAGIVSKEMEDKGDPGYQLLSQAMIWKPGNGIPRVDPIRIPRPSKEPPRSNPFFAELYRRSPVELQQIEAREHTAQVPSDRREQREKEFREGRLPLLFCSPTMELGIDIADLNFVGLRNVPPTPANYAQRSGRAGRSGSPALVLTYCSTGSSHDQYFFRRPELMVQGTVAPPRLDLANEDLLRAHVQAVWLGETGASLGQTLKDILDLSGEQPELQLFETIQSDFSNVHAKARARVICERILQSLSAELEASGWWTPEWLDTTLSQTEARFNAACERWRSLYLAALAQAKAQAKIILEAHRTSDEKERAHALRREAEAQLRLLTEGDTVAQSDFYSYRYFASEGFLPGYNFPRLPLSAFIPGRQRTKGEEEFLSRPRFIAISEFGPQSFVYHEGSRYKIHRVILPLDREEVFAQRVKRCQECGYLHPFTADPGPDLCEHCGNALGGKLFGLFRLQNVATKRRDRINSDEEDRLRMGYELQTGIVFPAGGAGRTRATVSDELGRLDYCPVATIWRINLGWAGRTNPNEIGFWLDVDRGFWERSPGEDDDPDEVGKNRKRVVPYVEDRRNALLFEPGVDLDPQIGASLLAAMKGAIQVLYQLEDGELAAELLPDPNAPRHLLFYEASEGGAGVLRRIASEPGALAEVARRALDLCHFDPATGKDRRRPPHRTEDCVSACYDCLMSYRNQRFHQLLDRHSIRDILLQLAAAQVQPSPTAADPAVHLEGLRNLAQSSLEQDFLTFLVERKLQLPSRAQVLYPDQKCRPDFVYDEDLTVVFVDGPTHDATRQAERDKSVRAAMEDAGYQVVAFRFDDDWSALVAKFPSVFGTTGAGRSTLQGGGA